MSNSGPAARERPHSVRRALLLGCAVALLGAACGQRGPLYLPQPEPQPAAADDAQSEAGGAGDDELEEKGAEEKDNE